MHWLKAWETRNVAKKLFISPRTVDTHRTNLMKKLDTHNVAGLVGPPSRPVL